MMPRGARRSNQKAHPSRLDQITVSRAVLIDQRCLHAGVTHAAYQLARVLAPDAGAAKWLLACRRSWKCGPTGAPAAASPRFQIVAKFAPKRESLHAAPIKTRPSGPDSANVSKWCTDAGTSHAGNDQCTRCTAAVQLGSSRMGRTRS